MENNEELFNLDFNLISDEEIDLQDVVAEPEAENKSEDIVLVDEDDTETKVETPKAEEKAKEEEDKIEIPTGDTEDKSEGKNKSPGSDNRDSSPVTPFASLLHEKGLLSDFDQEEFAAAVAESEDPFGVLTTAMQRELEIAKAGFINSFPPDFIDLAIAVSKGVPYEAMKGPKMDEINYSKITPESIGENEELQKKLVSDFYASKGFSEKRINKLIETLGDSGVLEEEATEAVSELAELAKEKQEQIKKNFEHQQKEMNDQYAAQIEYIGKSVDSVEEIIPGVKVTKGTKDRLFNNMTQIVGKDANGQSQNYTMAVRQQDPVKFDMTVAYLADITKGFTDWSKIKKSAKSSATSDLESVLNKKSTGHSYGNPKKTENRSETAEDEMMNSLSSMFNTK
tara:strand:- start:2496 stop:3686 length:1191 start_codon:yes stop_codon:yes gene_type:complete